MKVAREFSWRSIFCAKHGYEWRERASILKKRKNKHVASLHRKTSRNVLKNTLLSSSPDLVKLRSQFAVYIAQTSEREDGRDRTRRKSQSGHGALFMVGGFTLKATKQRKQLECLQRCN